MTLSERILILLKDTGETPSSLARAINCSAPAIQQWISGDTKNIKNELLFALADETGFEARWIATGEGPKRRDEGSATAGLTDGADAILAVYRSLPSHKKAELLTMSHFIQAQFLTEQTSAKKKPAAKTAKQ